MPFNPRLRPSLLTSAALIGLLLSGAACTPTKGPRTIRAAQSGAADACHYPLAGRRGSVSYTHLDVYKRQHMICPFDLSGG